MSRKRVTTVSRGTKVNQYGVRVTPKQQKELQSLVKRVNYLRKKEIAKAEAIAPPTYFREQKPVIFAPKKASTALADFKSQQEFNAYMKNLRKTLRPNFLSNRVALYKRNYIKAIQSVPEVNDTKLIWKIQRLTDAEFQRLIVENPTENISYVYYDPSRSKLQHLHNLVDNVKGTKY